jgi:hypothetical protein
MDATIEKPFEHTSSSPDPAAARIAANAKHFGDLFNALLWAETPEDGNAITEELIRFMQEG